MNVYDRNDDCIGPEIHPSEGIIQAVVDFNYVWLEVIVNDDDKAMVAMNLLGILYAPIPHVQVNEPPRAPDDVE